MSWWKEANVIEGLRESRGKFTCQEILRYGAPARFPLSELGIVHSPSATSTFVYSLVP